MACLAIVGLVFCSFAQPVMPVPSVGSAARAADTQSTLFLKFLNSRSGAAVSPNELLVYGTPVDFQVEAGSLVALSLTDGNHVIVVKAEGYETIEFNASVSGSETPVMEVELDSTHAQEELPVEVGNARLEGFVTDADTGALLSGVTLSLPDASLTTTTDETGTYGFTLAVPQKSDTSRPAITLEIKAKDYQAVRIKNLALIGGERRRMPLKLERVTSESQVADFKESDEAAPDGPHRTYDWAFDVTLK